MFMKNNIFSTAVSFTLVLDILSQNADILQISDESCRFEIHTRSLIWNEARRACHQRDMTLASLSDTLEAKSLSTLLKQADSMYNGLYNLEDGKYWVGLTKKTSEYYWEDYNPTPGVTDIFTDITQHNDVSGCGYINSQASVSITLCDDRGGFICENSDGNGACFTPLSTTVSPIGYDDISSLTYLNCASECLSTVSCAGVFVTAQDSCALLTYKTGLISSLSIAQLQSTHIYHRRLVYHSSYQAFTQSHYQSDSVIDTTTIEGQTTAEVIHPTTSIKPARDPTNTSSDGTRQSINDSTTCIMMYNNVTADNTEYSNGNDTECSGIPNENGTTNSIYNVSNYQSDTEGSGNHPDTLDDIDIFSTIDTSYVGTSILHDRVTIYSSNYQSDTEGSGNHPDTLDDIDIFSTIDTSYVGTSILHGRVTIYSSNYQSDTEGSGNHPNTPDEIGTINTFDTSYEGTSILHDRVTIYSSYGVGASFDQTDTIIDGTSIFTDQVVTTSTHDTNSLSSTREIVLISSSDVASTLNSQAFIGIASANSSFFRDYVTVPSSSLGGSAQVTTDGSIDEVSTLRFQGTSRDTSTEQTNSIGHSSNETSRQYTYPLWNSTLCECICRETDETQEEKLRRITSELALDKRSLSPAIRNRVSACDPRPSVRYVGYLGVAIITLFVGTIVCFDIPKFWRFLQREHDKNKKTRPV